MSFYQFTREDLIKVVDTDLFKRCEKECQKLCRDVIPKARLDNSKDKYDYEWYTYEGCCERVAVLIVYPLVKLLYPGIKLKLLSGEYHNVIVTNNFITTKPKETTYSRNLNDMLIFDPISLTLKLSVDWIYENIELINEENKLIDEEDICEWWTVEMCNGIYNEVVDLIDEIVTI